MSAAQRVPHHTWPCIKPDITRFWNRFFIHSTPPAYQEPVSCFSWIFGEKWPPWKEMPQRKLLAVDLYDLYTSAFAWQQNGRKIVDCSPNFLLLLTIVAFVVAVVPITQPALNFPDGTSRKFRFLGFLSWLLSSVSYLFFQRLNRLILNLGFFIASSRDFDRVSTIVNAISQFLEMWCMCYLDTNGYYHYGSDFSKLLVEQHRKAMTRTIFTYRFYPFTFFEKKRGEKKLTKNWRKKKKKKEKKKRKEKPPNFQPNKFSYSSIGWIYSNTP